MTESNLFRGFNGNQLIKLPNELNKTILYQMRASDLINQCKINLYFSNLCQSLHFWRDYVQSNYNINELVEDNLYLGFDSDDAKWNYLEREFFENYLQDYLSDDDKVIYNEKCRINTFYGLKASDNNCDFLYKMWALFLENSKMIDMYYLDGSNIEERTTIILYGDSKIKNLLAVGTADVLIGKYCKISYDKKSKKYKITSINQNLLDDELPTIDGDFKLMDVVVGPHTLFECLDALVIYSHYV